MKTQFSLKWVFPLLVAAPFVGAAMAQSVAMGVNTPAAVPSSCSAGVVGTPSVVLVSNGTHDGKLKIGASGDVTIAVVRTKGDHPELENLRVKFELNRQALVNALSPHIDGVTAAAFGFNGQPGYPLVAASRNYPPTVSNNGATLEWLVGMNAGTNERTQIGIPLNSTLMTAGGGTLKFLDTNNVTVSVPAAYSITCSVERI